MKLNLLALLLATVSFADTISLQPGETVTINPGTEKITLYCQAGGNSQLVDKFCICVDLGPQYMVNLEKHFIYSAGEKESVLLGRFKTPQDCAEALDQSKVCSHLID